MDNHLLHLALEKRLAEIRGGDATAWQLATRAMLTAKADDPEIEDSDAGVAIQLEDEDELARLVTGWKDGSLPLPESDKAILKRAMKAIRKRLKLARLDDESTLGGSAMTGGRESAISAVRAPEQYPDEVWQHLIAQNKLRDIGHDLIEIVE